MRTALLVGLALATGASLGCGSHPAKDPPGELPPDSLDHDAAGPFAGRWYGTVAVSIGGRSSQASAYLDVAVTGRNELTFPDFCSDGKGPPIRVISDTSFVVGGFACPIQASTCTVAWQVRGGSGGLAGDAFSFTMEGSASGCGASATMSVSFSGTRSAPPVDHGPPTAAVASSNLTASPGVPVSLDASASSDPDGRTLAFAWSVSQQPPGGDPTFTGALTATPIFSATVVGTYQLQVLVTASDGQSSTATVTVTVRVPRLAMSMVALPHGVLDAEYDRALDRIVMTDGRTDALYIHDPASGTETSVKLPLPPQCLSVGPDGTHALVGHNAWISYVDLVAARIEKAVPVAVDVGACTLGSGWAYVFPRDSWTSVHSVDLATHVESGGSLPYTGSRGVLTPDGRTLYAVTSAQSPMDLKRWDVSRGAAAYAWEMAYHGDFPVGDRIWMERSGARIFTSAGTAFRTSSVQAQDMVYAGTLSGLGAVAHLDSTADEIAAIPLASTWPYGNAVDDATVELLNSTFLGHVDRITLPWWEIGGSVVQVHGRFVFYRADGPRKYVLVQADGASGLLNDWAVLGYVGTRLIGGGATDHGPPVAVIAANAGTRPGVPLTLDGRASADPDGRALTYAWALPGQPANASLTGATTATPAFTATAEGAYPVQLTVTADDGQAATTQATVHVSAGAIAALAHGVARAEYSRGLDRLVMTDGNPNALYVHDPASGAETSVALPLAPQCLGLSPDGRFAVVGHNAWISYVDLAGGTLVKSIPASADVGDCVLGGNGWAYLFPRVDQWVALHSVEIATGAETLTSSWALYAGARARLHPDGSRIYSVTSQLSPANLERWSITGGAAAYAWASPYWGDHPIGPNLWIGADGSRAFTAAGTAFRLASAQAQDMVYAGALSSMPSVIHLDASATEIAAIPAGGATVELFDPTYLGRTSRIALPTWPVGGTAYPTRGRFVFYGADGAKKHVVVEADPSSGLLRGTAVLSF